MFDIASVALADVYKFGHMCLPHVYGCGAAPCYMVDCRLTRGRFANEKMILRCAHSGLITQAAQDQICSSHGPGSSVERGCENTCLLTTLHPFCLGHGDGVTGSMHAAGFESSCLRELPPEKVIHIPHQHIRFYRGSPLN